MAQSKLGLTRMWRSAAIILAAVALAGGTLFSMSRTAHANYGSGVLYQVEISANPGGVGFWIWSELGPGQASDYQETDCLHLGGGSATDTAVHDSGSLSGWSVNNGVLTMYGMKLIGGNVLANISVPVGPNVYGKVTGMTITVTSETAPFFQMNRPYIFPATGQIAP